MSIHTDQQQNQTWKRYWFYKKGIHLLSVKFKGKLLGKRALQNLGNNSFKIQFVP